MLQKKPKIVRKKWGLEKWLVNTSEYCAKELKLKEGYRCSLHSHKIKDETFYLARGRILMEIEEEGKIKEKVMLPGHYIRITPGKVHRFSGLEDSVIIESSTHHEDSDSYRIHGQESGKVPEYIKLKYWKAV